MKYACLIYIDPKHESTPAETAEYIDLAKDAMKQQVHAGGERLADPESATTVRIRNGSRTLSDGPFAETKEILGGFFLFDCPSIDQAIEWASRIPGARHGSIEVRPVVAVNM